jgi:hypothetical protein
MSIGANINLRQNTRPLPQRKINIGSEEQNGDQT